MLSRTQVSFLFTILMLSCNAFAMDDKKSAVVERKAKQASTFQCCVSPVSMDERCLNPCRGETMWQGSFVETLCLSKNKKIDVPVDVEITMSIPYADHESDVLGNGLLEHTIENIGEDPIKIFIAADQAKVTQQCGLVGLLISDNLVIANLGSLIPDVKKLQSLIQGVEAFAVKSGAKRTQFTISDKKRDLIHLFTSCGYAVRGKRSDLCSGGYDCCLYKKLSTITDEKVSNNAICVWLPRYDEQRQVAVAKDFFSEDLYNNIQEELTLNAKASYNIGVFVRNQGIVVGGCVGHVCLQSATPHLYVDMVWLSKTLRGKKLSETFIPILEARAKQFGCVKSHLNTADFNCPWLYKKLGYNAELIQPYYIKETNGNYSAEYDFYKTLILGPCQKM